VNNGIVVDFQEMQKVLAVRPEDFQVDVEAGVIYKELNKMLSRQGLFFPPDPGAAATIGGMIGNNASGIRTVKYGATKDHIARLVVVLPGGDVIRIGNRARKSSSGYDLIHLFVGAEGTLGLVTEATLRLVGLPAHFLALRVTFPEIRNATDTARAASIAARCRCVWPRRMNHSPMPRNTIVAAFRAALMWVRLDIAITRPISRRESSSFGSLTGHL
jgi:D-lactate dehydrogenase (cytochrome)